MAVRGQRRLAALIPVVTSTHRRRCSAAAWGSMTDLDRVRETNPLLLHDHDAAAELLQRVDTEQAIDQRNSQGRILAEGTEHHNMAWVPGGKARMSPHAPIKRDDHAYASIGRRLHHHLVRPSAELLMRVGPTQRRTADEPPQMTVARCVSGQRHPGSPLDGRILHR